ncbi:MAG: hypothetical protein EPN38_11380 [Rhodanobacteraceae bacterium]|nr:MAG: hypothetical protein EPN38_11380 [Rhodanobacteraceae bacterium]
MNLRIRWLAPLLATLLLVACSGGVSGTYEGGFGSIKFESGKAYATLMGITRQLDYSTDRDKVVLKSPEGNLVLTRNKDGSLDTPWGTMKKAN